LPFFCRNDVSNHYRWPSSVQPSSERQNAYGAPASSVSGNADNAFARGYTPVINTGQRREPGLGLYFYRARWYDPVIGRFLQADTLVPNPGDPQSLNRYAYVLNNPLRLVDPSGFAPQYPGDPDPNNAPCSTEWCWQNRWYNARGYGWDGTAWGSMIPPIYYDRGAINEVLSDAGITLSGGGGMTGSGLRMDWTDDRAEQIARGVALFGRALSGGIGALRRLLGNTTTTVHIFTSTGPECAFNNPCAPPPPYDTGNNIRLPVNIFGSYGANLHMLLVHELAHIVDWHSSIGGKSFSHAWSYEPITAYARDGWPPPWDRFAEAVAVFVLGSEYSRVASFLVTDYSSQMGALQSLLEGWR